jgi:hypothetical protein
VEPGGARLIREAQLGRDGSTASGVGRGVTRAAPPGSGKEVQRQVGRSEVRPGPGVAGVAVQGALGCGGGMDGSDARERERSERKKLWGRVLYPLMFVGPTHQLMNLSRLAYVVAVIPYVRRPPDEHIQI